jgi:uncharacterized protein
MTIESRRLAPNMVCAIALLASALVCTLPIAAGAQGAAPAQRYGIAVKRPVLQGACRNCPWGALGDAVKKMMVPYGYNVAVCYTCDRADGVRIVSKRLYPPEISDRQFAEGTLTRPQAPIDFGIISAEDVTWAYEGTGPFKKDGPIKNLRVIAQIDNPEYLMVAAVKSSGITDLKQISEQKRPVRMMVGVGGDLLDHVLEYYGMSEADIVAWGGKILQGNALLKNPDFDIIIGMGVLANNPEGNMWYEMTQKKNLRFFPIPEDLRQKLVKEDGAESVDLPFRYMRGVGDAPIPTVGIHGTDVYGRDDLPDPFVHDVAMALDEQRGLLKWTNQPFSYNEKIVWDGRGVPLHPAAAAYYRERGYVTQVADTGASEAAPPTP